nr:MAG TPA: hypothetical protein [Caudoviricetes sp.]
MVIANTTISTIISTTCKTIPVARCYSEQVTGYACSSLISMLIKQHHT